MLLLITGSFDGTADRLVLSYGDGVFRFNYDLWKDYNVNYSPTFWSIENPAGLKISSETATTTFWWKAFGYSLEDDRLIKEEVKYFLRDIYGWFATRGLAKGNSPYYHHYPFSKINILTYASKYFLIPKTLFSIGLNSHKDFPNKNLVAKSLSSEISEDKTVLLTNPISSINKLDPSYPWFLQEEIKSEWDITVFLCGEKLFPFKRSRKELKGIDWRAEQDFEFTKQEWFPFKMTKKQVENLLDLASDLNVEFGRFDFMTQEKSNNLVFLELNASGQWVFLDIHNKYGLLDCFIDWLKDIK